MSATNFDSRDAVQLCMADVLDEIASSTRMGPENMRDEARHALSSRPQAVLRLMRSLVEMRTKAEEYRQAIRLSMDPVRGSALVCAEAAVALDKALNEVHAAELNLAREDARSFARFARPVGTAAIYSEAAS